MKKLSIKGKIALPFVFLPFLGFLIVAAAITILIGIVQFILRIFGFGDALIFLFDLAKDRTKRLKYRQEFKKSENKIK